MKKIYFIMNSVSDPHANRRINEFVSNGYYVKIYGFERDNKPKSNSNAVVLGRFSNALSYRKRVSIYIKALRQLFKEHSKDNCIWFYQGLDIALFASFLNKRNSIYIYEECDLVHTNIKNKFVCNMMEYLDKRIISKSYMIILTSDGFVDYHYGSDERKKPNNIVVIPNKLPKEMLNVQAFQKEGLDKKKIRFAFVGIMRYHSLASFADTICKHFPSHEFHFYGYVASTMDAKELPQGENVFYHGAYKSPDDLPDIYKSVDVLVATYDTRFSINTRCAEPNKLYEAIYFRCPIVVSKNTFLAQKVERLGIGYSVDAFNANDVITLVESIQDTWNDKVYNLCKINKQEAIDENDVNRIINKDIMD